MYITKQMPKQTIHINKSDYHYQYHHQQEVHSSST